MSNPIPLPPSVSLRDDAALLRSMVDATRGLTRSFSELPVADLVQAADTASTLVQRAAAELETRPLDEVVAARRRTLVAAPSLLAHSADNTVTTILSNESLRQQVVELEDNVSFNVDPRTRGGFRLTSMLGQVGHIPLDHVRPDATALEDTVDALLKAGFKVLRIGRFGVRASGPARLVAEVLGEPLTVTATMRRINPQATRRPAGAPLPPTPAELFVRPQRSLSADGSRLHKAINDFVFVPPPLLLGLPPQAYPATIPHWALHQNAVRELLRVPIGPRGAGVKLALVDSGFDFTHPYFSHGNYSVIAIDTSAGPNANIDLAGHGTAMAANVLGIAPACEVLGFKHTDPGGAIEEAADAQASIISCSWGYGGEQLFPQMQLSIRSVIEDDGCIVLFAAGNGQRCWPASEPGVLAIGGVFADPATSQLQASNYASGFTSDLYPNRKVPDLCGLCGQTPAGIYLPLPVPPGSEMDRATGGGAFPEKDETEADDGWVYASGTSSATAQVAGIVALMLERRRAQGKGLTLAQARSWLQQSAQPVTQGHNVFGFPAVGHPNPAVGFGLADVEAVLELCTKEP